MMLRCFYIFIWIFGFKFCLSQRRIVHGDESVQGKKYLVYFVKSPYTKTYDESWLCGGALVTSTQILTSAACLVEMERIYAIAGYKKYVNGKDINNDECTRTRKQKVIRITVPKEYELSSENPYAWMNVDIGVATVEKPYNFSDLTYRDVCSYEPKTIFINFEKQNEMEKTRTVVFGWGATKARKPSEPSSKNINSKYLQVASTVIATKSTCYNLATNEEFKKLLDKYLICTSGNGYLNEDGLDVCPSGRRYESSNNTCIDEYFEFRSMDENNNETTETNFTEKQTIISQKNVTRRKRSASPGICQVLKCGNRPIGVVTANYANKTKIYYVSCKRRLCMLFYVQNQIIVCGIYDERTSNNFKLNTFKNDHGGPLVRWVGLQEMIVGVALNGAYNENYECVGPFLYVSTALTGDIIKCLLETDPILLQVCNNKLVDKKYEVKEIPIKWPQDTSRQSNMNISSFLRQGDDELPLHMRPTKELEVDEFGNPQKNEHVYEVQLNQKKPLNFNQKNQNQGILNGQTKLKLQGQTQDQTLDQVYEHIYQQTREESTSQPYQSPQIELFKPIQESYGQPQADILKQPLIDPLKQTQVGLPKQTPIPEIFNPPQIFDEPPVTSFRLPIVEKYKPQNIFKQTPIAETDEQPQLHLLEQHTSQVVASANALRERPVSTFESTFDLIRDEPQSLEQMYSQLHGPTPEIKSLPLASEQTFEELYKNLHDPALELPHEQGFTIPRESHASQQFDNHYEQRYISEHRFEQSSGQHYEQPPPPQQRFEQRPNPEYQQPAEHRFEQSRYEHPPDLRMDHPLDSPYEHRPESRYERPPDPQYEHPPESRYDHPPDPRYDHPSDPRYDRQQEARYPPEATYGQETRYEQPPLDPRYDHPPEQRYDHPAEQRYEQPLDPRYEQPPEPRYEQPPEPRYEQPPEARYEQPPEPRYDQPYGQGYDQMKQPNAAPNIPQPEAVDPQEEVKVRPQVPLDYQSDSFSYAANSRTGP